MDIEYAANKIWNSSPTKLRMIKEISKFKLAEKE